jgi:hypothetical protein
VVVSATNYKQKEWEDPVTVGVFFDHLKVLNSLFRGEKYQIFQKDVHTLVIVYLKEGEKI